MILKFQWVSGIFLKQEDSGAQVWVRRFPFVCGRSFCDVDFWWNESMVYFSLQLKNSVEVQEGKIHTVQKYLKWNTLCWRKKSACNHGVLLKKNTGALHYTIKSNVWFIYARLKGLQHYFLPPVGNVLLVMYFWQKWLSFYYILKGIEQCAHLCFLEASGNKVWPRRRCSERCKIIHALCSLYVEYSGT